MNRKIFALRNFLCYNEVNDGKLIQGGVSMLIFLSMIDSEQEQSEFEQIYLQHGELVFRKTLAVLHNQQDTEDVMQEVWIKVAQNISFFRDKNDAVVFSYIMKIATNQTMTFFRKQRKNEIAFTEEDLDGIVCDDTLFHICESIEIDEIAACFAALPDIYRDILSLYFFHHHTAEQIARLLGMKPATVSSRINRGRKKLIELLERRGIHG